MKNNKNLLAIGLLLVMASSARAGVLASDGSSFMGVWHGSTLFQGFDTLNNPTDFSGVVEWAVYAPNSFPGAFGGYSPLANEFVYAYQAFPIGAAALSEIHIGLYDVANNIGTFSGGGVAGDAPFADYISPLDAAVWLYPGVLTGGSTKGMVFSSPYGPSPYRGTAIDHGSAAAFIPVPAPDRHSSIPEPSTMTLAIVGFLGIASAWLRRHMRTALGWLPLVAARNDFIHIRTIRWLLLVATLCCWTLPVLAGPLPTDPAALAGFKGVASFTGTTGSATLNVTVEYAVYAPGAYPSAAFSAPPGPPPDPSNGADYVYAFEAFNNASGNANMSSLSVGLRAGTIPTGSTNIGSTLLTTEIGTAPNFSQFIPVVGDPKQSAKWTYTTNLLSPGGHSDILYFTSPFTPAFILSSMLGNGSTIASAMLPSPVHTPEPSSLVLLTAGIVGLLLAARRKAR